MPEHGHRYSPGQVYSAEDLGEILAIPCLYLLAGKGQAVFPNTTTASPSSWVSVIRQGKIPGINYPNHAVTVNWRQWRDVVVPVLEDPRWALHENPLWQGRRGRLVELLQVALQQSGEAAGYGDPTDLLDG